MHHRVCAMAWLRPGRQALLFVTLKTAHPVWTQSHTSRLSSMMVHVTGEVVNILQPEAKHRAC